MARFDAKEKLISLSPPSVFMRPFSSRAISSGWFFAQSGGGYIVRSQMNHAEGWARLLSSARKSKSAGSNSPSFGQYCPLRVHTVTTLSGASEWRTEVPRGHVVPHSA